MLEEGIEDWLVLGTQSGPEELPALVLLLQLASVGWYGSTHNVHRLVPSVNQLKSPRALNKKHACWHAKNPIYCIRSSQRVSVTERVKPSSAVN
jgi:hypothetical protein